jgi:hypothetical protein
VSLNVSGVLGWAVGFYGSADITLSIPLQNPTDWQVGASTTEGYGAVISPDPVVFAGIGGGVALFDNSGVHVGESEGYTLQVFGVDGIGALAGGKLYGDCNKDTFHLDQSSIDLNSDACVGDPSGGFFLGPIETQTWDITDGTKRVVKKVWDWLKPYLPNV